MDLPNHPGGPALRLDEPADVARASAALAGGTALAHGFANIYALTSRPEADAVRAVNVLKGRPPDQTGSVVTTPPRLLDAFDTSALPAGFGRDRLLDVCDLLLSAGPCGLRGPAAPSVPDHLCRTDRGVRTTQVIAPGYACPSNALLAACLAATGLGHLHLTSANRSHHVTGQVEEPAHHRAADLEDDLGADLDGERLLLVAHGDEAAVAARYPGYEPMSTTVVGFSRLPAGTARPVLTVERHGSLPVAAVRELLAAAGCDVVVAPAAGTRLPRRP